MTVNCFTQNEVALEGQLARQGIFPQRGVNGQVAFQVHVHRANLRQPPAARPSNQGKTSFGIPLREFPSEGHASSGCGLDVNNLLCISVELI
jgi:hypothetical protein